MRRCHEVHRMAGIRVYPNYHGYTLEEPAFTKLLTMAATRKLIVQIALSMEDTRTQFPLMHVPPVDPEPLADLLLRFPQLRVMLLNFAAWTDEEASSSVVKITKAQNAYFDIAMNEGVGGLARLIEVTSPSRVVFGSHSPFYYFESAELKVRSANLPRDQELALTEGNATSLLAAV